MLLKTLENLECRSSVEGPNPAWHVAMETDAAPCGTLLLVLCSSDELQHRGRPSPLPAQRAGDLDPSQLCFGEHLYLPAVSHSSGK